MRELIGYIKIGFGIYSGYIIAKYVDKYLTKKYNKYLTIKDDKNTDESIY